MSNPFTVEYDGWQYISDPTKPDNESLTIIPPVEIEKSDCLYKYYGLSEYSIDALKKSYIYASCPFELNDPFDSMNLLIDYKNVSDEFLVQFYEKCNEKREDIILNKAIFKSKFPMLFALKLYTRMGIISLTPNGTNPLMWAHYSGAHEGFAVKFKNEHLKANNQLAGPFPINYRTNWRPIDINVHPAIAFLYQTNIKNDIWEYEKEWRYVAIGKNMYVADANNESYEERKQKRDNRKMKYPPNAIDEIILGFKFINGLVKQDCKNGICKLEFINSEEFNAKKELLNFICDNNIPTSKIHLKNGSVSFELETKPVVIDRITPHSFIMKS